MRFAHARFSRMLLLLLAVLMLLPAVSAESGIADAPKRSQQVRVLLTRPGVTDRLDLLLVSPYLLTCANGTAVYLPQGIQLSLQTGEDGIILYYGELRLNAGHSIRLSRTEEGGRETGFRRVNFPALYNGDLDVALKDGRLRLILTLHVEDYLLGVVPYEMNDLFPLEALKAQAVAARTYALRKQDASAEYDLVDTTTDQVFAGYLPGNICCEKAIRETRGVCGFYGSRLAQCWYSASNGGQTELPSTVWPSRDEDAYYASVQDPYDIENDASTVQKIEIPRQGGDDVPYVFRKLVCSLLKDELTARGMDPSPESLRIDRVTAVSVDTPNRAGSLLMTRLNLTVEVSARTRTEETPAGSEDVTILVISEETASPLPTATPIVTYGEFVPLGQSFSLCADVFPTAENLLGLNISSNFQNEIWSVAETESSFVIEARRYGHGVGMSQRGAQQMAASHGFSYQDILAFYYPGMRLARFPEEKTSFRPVAESLARTAGPAITPTPKPTRMVLSTTPEPGQWLVRVTEIADDSTLNLRSSPSTGASVLMRLVKNQELIVLEKCPEEGWLHVRVNDLEGYIMEKFVTKN